MTATVAIPTTASGVRPRRVLTAASLGTGMAVVDMSIVNVAVPAVRADLHVGLATMQLVVDAYVIVMAGLVLAGAAAVGRFGAVPMFRLGVAVFGATSVLCGAAPSGPVLIAMRAAQALGGILMAPATLVMLTRTYRDQDDRAKAVAVWATAAGSPVAFGPILGGALVAAVGWRGIFFVNAPVAVLTLWLSARYMPEEPDEAAAREPQDIAGQLLAVVVLGGLALALTEGRQLGWTHPVAYVSALVCVLALGGFLVRQRTCRYPMIPADLFRAPGFRGYIAVGLLLFAGYYGLVFSISVFLQQVRGYGPVATGTVFLASAVPITVMPLVAGRLNARLGARRVLGTACAVTLAGGVLLAAAGSAVPAGICLGLVFVGLGFGLATVPQITLSMAAAPPHRAPIASGLLSAGRQTGTTLGIAVLGGLQSGRGIAGPAVAAVVVYAGMAGAWLLAGRRTGS